jgi:putative glutamine amidotransferase
VKPVIGITASMDDGSLRIRAEYAAAIEGSGGVPFVLPVCAQIELFADLIDGLMLTGGGDIPPGYFGQELMVPSGCLKAEKKERIDFELALVHAALKKKRPLLAICYGMQLLNVAQGGTLIQDIGLLRQDVLDHKTGNHGIRIISPPWAGPEGTYKINSYHHQAVDNPGEGLEVFARADDGIIEGIYKRDYTFCVGVQWHPERCAAEPLSEGLFKAFIEKAAETRRHRGSGNPK